MKHFLSLFFILYNPFSSFAQCPPEYTFNAQSQLDEFPILYPNCSEIQGDIIIYGNDIQDLSPLSNLQSIGGALRIGWGFTQNNNLLENLNGLENLTFVGGSISIRYNLILSDISSLSNVTEIGGSLSLDENEQLENLNGLENITEVDDLNIRRNVLVPNLLPLSALSTIRGDLTIDNTSIINCSGLENITRIGDDLLIKSNDSLTSLTGLENIEVIVEALNIRGNELLADFSGLSKLDSIENCSIVSNDLLESLLGLQQLSHIGGGIRINNNPSLNCISSLRNVSSFTALNMFIENNVQLEFCAIESFCFFLDNPSATISAFNNGPGCNSQFDIESACKNQVEDPCYIPVRLHPKPPSSFDLRITPNPSNGLYTITTNNSIQYQATIFNSNGISLCDLVFIKQTNLDFSNYPAGVYFIKISNSKGTTTQSFVKF